MVPGIGGAAPRTDSLRALDDLGQLLKDTQAQVLAMAEKLLKVGVQQTVEDSALGNRVDLTA